jgi:hypothetical protein
LREITAPIHDADDFDLSYRTFVGVGMSLEKNDVRRDDEHSHRRPDIWSARAEAGMSRQTINLPTDFTQ